VIEDPRDCPYCNWSQPDEDGRKLAAHQRLRHPDLVAPLPEAAQPLQQLPKVAFQTAFLAAVKTLPIGWVGTTADLHALVPPPADHHWWGTATKAAGHMGLLRSIDTQQSELGTTNGSLVHTWQRVDETQRRRAGVPV
jgi:hypothetical protein